ncbi:MAG: polysaccharide deacetylase family protein [Anaerolineae bacterium]
MNPNPVLKRLGFADDDRVVILHADDVGMCQASLTAFAELVDFGLISSGAVMVPCPWFPAVVAYCQKHPGVDLGVHLTLTSEWDAYRWGPISTRDPASGLLDAEGYFHHRSEEAQESGDPAAVQAELEAQVGRALAAGIDVSHIDTHMGTVAHPKFMAGYVQLALQHRLPAMIPRLDEAGWHEMGMEDEMAALAAQFVAQMEAQGMPLLDGLVGLPLEEEPGDRLAVAKEELGALPPGLTHFIFHPAVDTPELRAITPRWRSRVADYETFRSEELRAWMRDEGLHVVGYRALRALLREA